MLAVLEQLDLVLRKGLKNLAGSPENEELLITNEDELSHFVET